MGKSEKELEIERFLEEVKVFNAVTAEEAEALLKIKGSILFIGRETCPYCRKFVRKLSPLAVEHDFTVNYLHSQPADGQEAVDALRDKYEVPTVPGFLYVEEEGKVTVKCDSSLSPEEILEIIKLT